MESTRDIEKLFYQDVRFKKKIGSNIFKRKATRKGGTNMSTMRVPSRKEQREKSGKVMTFNLNEIIPIDEFEQKPLADQKLLMEHWRTVYKAKDIIDKMGVNRNAYYNLIDHLGIKKADRRPKDKRDKPIYKAPNIVTDNAIPKEKEAVKTTSTAIAEPEKEEMKHMVNVDSNVNEFNFSLKGLYHSEDVARRLMLLINEIELSDDKLNIEIKVSK